MIKPLMRHLQGLVAVDQRPGNNITNISNKHNKKIKYRGGKHIRMFKEEYQRTSKILCIPDAYMLCAFPRHIFHCVFVLPVMEKSSVDIMDIRQNII